ncbi:MAG: hypothetical protein II563_07725, partial [Treponema sp.]|nr:hypothetical protein [Treponema sp.]
PENCFRHGWRRHNLFWIFSTDQTAHPVLPRLLRDKKLLALFLCCGIISGHIYCCRAEDEKRKQEWEII